MIKTLAVYIAPEAGIHNELLDRYLKKPNLNSVFLRKFIRSFCWPFFATIDDTDLIDGIKSTDHILFEIEKQIEEKK